MLDVVVLFFLFGLLAGLVRSELKLPPALYDTLSLFLLLAIGLKGGVGLAQQSLQPLLPQLALVILLGVVQTLLGFAVLRLKMNRVDAAATAAHYGSVSVATFAVGVNWLTERGISFESQLSIFLAVMEIPAILVGIVLARGISRETRWRMLAHETFLGKGVTLLLGGMAIGYLAGPDGIAPLKPLFVDLFKGRWRWFLLEMGLIVARQCQDLRRHGLFLLGFALLMPLASAGLGLAAGQLMGLSLGGLTLLATTAASASYIAVPATMRIAVPRANPGLSLSAVLGSPSRSTSCWGSRSTTAGPATSRSSHMQTETRTLLTVITEANLEPTLLRTLTREGLRGYTITDARGRGIMASATPAGARAATSGWRRSAAGSRRNGCWPTCRVATTPITP